MTCPESHARAESDGPETTFDIDGVISAVPTTMFVVDDNLIVQHVSQETLDALGYGRDEVVGKMTCGELCKTPLCGTPECTIKRCWQSREKVVGETQAVTRTGQEIPIAAYSSAIFDHEGNPAGAMELIVDLTEQKDALKEVGRLIDAARDGELAQRADVSLATSDDYRQLFEGLNEMLDALVNPLNTAAEYIDRISDGDIPEPISDEYHGDFNQIKNNINMCIGAINRLIADANMVADAVAQKKLDVRADPGRHRGDYERIVQGINETVDAMDMAMSPVAAAIIQIAAASDQISQGAQTLAEGSAEQASSLEEVSASLEQMAAMTQQNAANAQEADSLSDVAAGAAQKGNEAMQRMSKAISDIQQSSEETSKIVKTIDEIAFQTNLLALNAAVEAARAGDAGKGFAVVAEEVRNLAQRSAEAAKNTANMIEEAVKNAETGVSISEEVDEALTEIADGSRKVSGLIAEIAAASNEQAQGLEQVNTAAGQMDEVTQQNAANAEESASAAEEISAQTDELRNMVDAFTLSKAVSAAAAAGPGELTLVSNGGTAPAAGQAKSPSRKQQAEETIPLDDEDRQALANF
ncbi:MAG: methyl-accepting chemotaxis protein [Armatimonadota bacterium]